jgi:hypothetical protein
MTPVRCLLTLGFGLLVAGVARADLRYGVSAGVGHSSNIERTDDAEISESIASVGLDLDWNAASRRLEGEAALDLQYLEYLDDTFESELSGTADASLQLSFVPERFGWSIQDSFGQATSDPFSPSTPDNRENINFFSTGPTLSLRLGEVGMLRVLGQWSLVDYEESLLDGERRTYGLSLERRPSARSLLSLNAVVDDVLFDDTPGSDYQRSSAYLGYEIEGGRTELTTSLGYSKIEFDSGASDDGLLASLVVSRRMSSNSTLDLRVGTQLMDAADALREFAGGGLGGGGVQSGIAASAEPFENREIALAYHLSRRRTDVMLSAARNQNRYVENAALDRDRTVYSATVTRVFRQRLNLSLIASRTDDEFLASSVDAEELNYGAILQWQLSPSLSLRATLDRFERDTSSGLGEYGENRAWLSLRWQRPGGNGP